MTTAALVAFGVYLGVGFGLRTWVQWRRTGDAGFRGISGRPGSPEWAAGVGFVAALLAGVAGPVTALLWPQTLGPLPVFTHLAVQWFGVVLTVTGVAATCATQTAMGSSWRIGVDAEETTDLVTTGPFALARNPIFTAMTATGLGLVLMVPNVIALVGFGLLLVALELQVRVVEEPYLRATHREAYARYEATTGRFWPGIGKARTRAVRPADVLEGLTHAD
jgi:protein-S-isoprenylcysteine O-methyltransferase Ste14